MHRYALNAGEGFLVAKGEVGTGKTLLLQRLPEYAASVLAGSIRAEFVTQPGAAFHRPGSVGAVTGGADR
jgi:hypothetical protein